VAKANPFRHLNRNDPLLARLAGGVVGFVISSFGYHQIAANHSPEVVGDHGVTKFPHGIAIHALQILPAIAWLMRCFNLGWGRGVKLSSVSACLSRFSLLSLVTKRQAGLRDFRSAKSGTT
jgi:hypothetical protein